MTNIVNEEFSLSKLRLAPDVVAGLTVKQVLSVPVHKPPRHDWIRVHPEWRHDTMGLVFKDGDDALYIVEEQVVSALACELTPFSLLPYINRVGVLRIWPLRLPGSDGREMEWHRSARVAAAQAVTGWVRVAANTSLGAYEIFTTPAQLPEPKWPEMSLEEMIKIAFHDRGKIIRSADHPVVRALDGRLS
jgi:hypothetical protein